MSVTAHVCGGQTYYSTTNEKGIYAFTAVPSDTTYHVATTELGLRFGTARVATGKSNYYSFVSGNISGVELVGAPSYGFIDLEQQTYVVPEVITVRVVDMDLVGRGNHDVLLKICGGDSETVRLSEYPAASGVFIGDLATAAGTASIEDGTLQVLGTKQVVAVYEDGDDGMGHAATLRDTATIAQQTSRIYETGFDTGLPSGWSVLENAIDGFTWMSRNPSGYSSPYWNGRFMIVDCPYSSYLEMDEELISRRFDCSEYEKVMLSFSHSFRYDYIISFQVGEVDVRVGEGAWNRVAHFQGAEAAGVVTLDISSIAARQQDVQVRWHYWNTMFDWYWGIDNVKVDGVVSPPTGICDVEADCDIDFGDFAKFAMYWAQSDCGECGSADFSDDGAVGAMDLTQFASHWLEHLE